MEIGVTFLGSTLYLKYEVEVLVGIKLNKELRMRNAPQKQTE